MAKTRMVNTKFWTDSYILNLDPIEKLLYLYILTNPYTDISGVYELPLKVAAVETGLDREMVEKVLKRFESDDKIKFANGWISIKNFIKNQSTNPSVEKGIQIGLSKAPPEHRLYTGSDTPSHLNLNLNPDLNPNFINTSEARLRSPETQVIPTDEDGNEIKPKKTVTKKKFFHPVTSKDYTFESYMEGLDNHPMEEYQLMAHFFRERHLRFETLDEMQEALKRHYNAAQKVVKFPKDKVFKAIGRTKQQHSDIDWSLDTVLKKLTN